MTDVFYGSYNIYKDIGFSDAKEMLIKAQLANKISQILKEKNLTQKQASQFLKISQPKLSKLLNGEFRGISEMKMLECLVQLGNDIKIVISSERVETPKGQLEVVFAPI
ncbi:helix-turn-helix domain-containing protein [Bartonella sp. CB189]|uniref:helix-turn-helix domain-containing protein n=1 Tax=Bartonella sp. CB189 TaxID=3112254 RepID=UPI002F9642E0